MAPPRLLLLILLALPLAAPPAASAEIALPPVLPAVLTQEEAEEAEETEGEAAIEECEEEGEEVEACEEEEETEDRYPPECVLRSAKAHAAAKGNTLKVTIGYTAYEPTKATIEIRYGSTKLGSFKRRLGKSGVLRFSKPTKQEGKRLTVRVDGGVGCPSRRLVLFPK